MSLSSYHFTIVFIAGWDFAMHYGSLVGAYSMITIFPTEGFGIFTSYNGAVQSDPYTINALLHTSLADLYLTPDANPPVPKNTLWCDLPQPILQMMYPTSYDLAYNGSSPLTTLSRHLNPYSGQFHHSVLGTLEQVLCQFHHSVLGTFEVISFIYQHT